jgi:Carboxypeptidase regulatory-like domain
VEAIIVSIILQQIGTPLQLIALFLLLTAGVARLLVRSGSWKPSPAISRLLINRLFQAGIVAVVVGVASTSIGPVLDRWLSGDEVFHGAVLSLTGDPVSGATVNLITVGTVTTNALGQFDITVPRSRTLQEYKVEVKASGYQSLAPLTKTAAEMKNNIELRLSPAPSNLLRALEPDLFVAQYYGVPIIVVTLRVENTGSATTPINNISGTLSGKDTSLFLSPVSWTIQNPFGPFVSVTGPFPIFAKASLDLRVIMTPGANLSVLFQKLGTLPEYKSGAPCVQKPFGPAEPLSDNGFDLVNAFAENHFIWKAGQWHLQLDVAAENEAKTFHRDFSLSENDVQRLRKSISLVKQCLTVNLQAPLAQEGGLANFVTK